MVDPAGAHRVGQRGAGASADGEGEGEGEGRRTRSCAHDAERHARVAQHFLGSLPAFASRARARAAVRRPERAPDRLDDVLVLVAAPTTIVARRRRRRGAQALAAVRDPGVRVGPADLDAREALREGREGEVERWGGEGEVDGRGRGSLREVRSGQLPDGQFRCRAGAARCRRAGQTPTSSRGRREPTTHLLVPRDLDGRVGGPE